MKRFSFPKSRKLTSNSQFKAVMARNMCISSGVFTLYMAENRCSYPRLGISVGKSCGGAVIRNRLKRLLREVFRQCQGQIPAGFDYLLIVSPQRKELDKSAGLKETARHFDFELGKALFLRLVYTLTGAERGSVRST